MNQIQPAFPVFAIETTPKGPTWTLAVEYEAHRLGRSVKVPPGFSFDGATIPWPLWRRYYSPFDPVVMTPALVHDWLYCSHEMSRSEADDWFRDLLIGSGVPTYKAWLMWTAVDRMGGRYWPNTDPDLAYLRGLRDRLPESEQFRYCWPDFRGSIRK
jgi:hypothetical protein